MIFTWSVGSFILYPSQTVVEVTNTSKLPSGAGLLSGKSRASFGIVEVGLCVWNAFCPVLPLPFKRLDCPGAMHFTLVSSYRGAIASCSPFGQHFLTKCPFAPSRERRAMKRNPVDLLIIIFVSLFTSCSERICQIWMMESRQAQQLRILCRVRNQDQLVVLRRRPL